jgi:hypothetical protein
MSTIYLRQNGTDIQESSNYTTWTTISSFPKTFTNPSPSTTNILTINLITNLTINSTTKYFIIGSQYITFEGNNKTVTINNTSNYLGLIRNGTSLLNDGFSNVVIQNLGVLAVNSTLSSVSNIGADGYVKLIGHEVLLTVLLVIVMQMVQ